VNGQTWNVARPLGIDAGFGFSWCTQADALSTLMDEANRKKYRDFLNAIHDATKHCYEGIDLSVAGRQAKWTDLLGWLSRDQDCHFAHHAHWRTTESEAGPRVLTREDAYLVMKMALGLLSPEETSLMSKHRELLSRKNHAEASIKRYEDYIEEADNELRATVDDLRDDIPGEMLGERLADIARQKIKSLYDLLEDMDPNSYENLQDIRSIIESLTKREGAIESILADLQNSHQCKTQELTLKQGQEVDAFLADLLGAGWKCSYYPKKEQAEAAGCPGTSMKRQDIVDPARRRIINEIQDELAAIAKKRALLAGELASVRAKNSDQKSILIGKLRESVKHRDRISSQIGQWQAKTDQARRYCTAWQNLDALKKALEKHKKAILKSSAEQNDYRMKMQQERVLLSSYYSLVLKQAIDPDAEGEIVIDANSIRPQPNAAVADSGTTLRTYADILSFDLACLTAAVCGIGNMPRLWIHDSPRQADSEDELYHSILRFVWDIEKCFDSSRSVNFQYILTTTSQPPSEINSRPFVRLRLHGRNDSGKLMRRTFGK